MPFIMNALDTPVHTQAHGQWFLWKPKQIKEIQNVNLALFLTQNRGEEGLVGVPDHVMEMKEEKPEEYKLAIEDLVKEGIEKRINRLNMIITNLEQSLRYDLELKNIKGDPLSYASKGELAAYKELATLKQYERAQRLNVAEEIRKIKDTLDGDTSDAQSGAHNQGRPDPVKPAQSRK